MQPSDIGPQYKSKLRESANFAVWSIKKAIKDLEKALELDNQFVDAMYAMAAAYKKLEDYHKTLEYIEKLLVISPEHVYARALKKLILQKYII